MLRPPTHDRPNAIPRNGTEVPWVDLPEPRAGEGSESSPAGRPGDVAAGSDADGDGMGEGLPADR